MAAAAVPLPVAGLPGPVAAEHVGRGRYRLPSGSCTIDPFLPMVAEEERSLLKKTEISKMKGQGLRSAHNAKLVAVNLRYINYVMKEGVIRVINQNGRDLFKVHNTTKASLIDLAITGTGVGEDQGTTLLCVDEGARVNVFMLEALGNSLAPSDKRVKQIEMIFDGHEPPKRVLGHTTNPRVFVTIHTSYLWVWDVTKLEQLAEKGPEDVYFYKVDPETSAKAGTQAHLPEVTNSSSPSSASARIMSKIQAAVSADRFRDATVSVDGSCLLVLTSDAVFVWQLLPSKPDRGWGLQLIQTLSLPQGVADLGGLHSIRALGDCQGPDSPYDAEDDFTEVIVLAAGTGTQLLVYRFSPRHPTPVGKLLQSIHVVCPSKEVPELTARMEVNYITRSCLALAFQEVEGLLVLPLAAGSLSSRPLPFAQRLVTDAPAHQLSLMTGKSFDKARQTLFLYHANTFTREKDGLPGCAVAVNELVDPSVVERQAVDSESAMEPGASEGLAPPPGLEIPNGSGTEDAHVEVAAAAESAAEEDEARSSGLQAGDATTSGAAGEEGYRPELGLELDWGFVKQIAASFARGLEKRRGNMAEMILNEVREAMQNAPAEPTAADLALLEQAISKVRDTKEAQAAGERSLQAAVKKATDGWAELAAGAVTGLLQKELSKISDGVAATLAQQLSQSRKFCEALARGVQKSSGTAAKQAIESMRPAKQFQDTVNVAMVEGLREALAPVFKTELRAHFEQELAPLLGRRVSDILSAFRSRMADCFEGLAAEHEEAARRLGQDIGALLAEEMKQVRQAAAPAAGPGVALSETQLDELTRAVRVEIVQPLHAQIQDLTAQVKALKETASLLEQRCGLRGGAGDDTSAGAGGSSSSSPAEDEEAQAVEVERLFRDGKVEQAILTAIKQQTSAKHVDFLGRVCGLVPDSSTWLSPSGSSSDSPIKMPTKMLLMLALARQLETMELSPESLVLKLEWVNELWLAFEPTDPTVVDNAKQLCKSLNEVLERVPQPSDTGAAGMLRQLHKGVAQAAKLLRSV